MSHTVIADFRCNAGTGADFLKVLREGLADTRAFEGCELIEIYADADDADRVFLFEKWTTRENHAAYMKWRVESGGMVEMLGPFMSGAPEMIHMEALEG
jgi:quinol monooxygenase YgiN